MDVMEEFNYRAEYSKSNRASCKTCKNKIDKDVLRLARLVQSPAFDGKVPHWYHPHCFYVKQRPNGIEDIEGFEKLRYEDQQSIKEKISSIGPVVAPAKGKGNKRSAESNVALKDYGIEYAASSRSTCRGCEDKIIKDMIRVKKIDYDSEVATKIGGEPLWHHMECFVKLRAELGFFAGGEILPGYHQLTTDDRKLVKKALPTIKVEKQEGGASKKMKKEASDELDAGSSKKDIIESQIAKQSVLFYKFKDGMKSLSKSDIEIFLKANKSFIPVGIEDMLDRSADILTFGRLPKCEKCKGDYVFNKTGYFCNGNLDEWTKCYDYAQKPERTKAKVPSELKEKCSELNKALLVQDRITREGKIPAKSLKNVKTEKEEENSGPRIKRQREPLYGLHFVAFGNLKTPKEELKEMISKLGGKLTTKLHDKLAAIISTKDEVSKMNKRMQEVQELDIQVVDESFLEAAKSGDVLEKIKSMAICDWGSEPMSRIPAEEERKKESIYTKNVAKQVTLKLKGGSAVDPDSMLADICHVYKEDKVLYASVLGLTDIQKGKNSYYKLQVLESDKGQKYWLFRSWGRIGTTIGDCKTEKMGSAKEAKDRFEELFLEKSNNHWEMRKNFKKYPGKMYPIDVDYDQDEKVKKMSENSQIQSKLAKPVQDLVRLLFDVETMKKAMLEFDLDMEKMPLGRLSQEQLQKALLVLCEVSQLITSGAANSQFISASNRFYTIIPHDFGIQNPPIIDTVQMVKDKTDMLEALMEIEIAYNLINEGDDSVQMNPLDNHYEQLKTELVPMDKGSEEFGLLQKYMKNTHAKTHNTFDLEIGEVFKVKRKGEERRYKPFRKLHNRKLLWHGSRLTNYVGILSHGLKIAPPEAPVTGYMFGKGIYFADMVSKSANYCATSKDNSTGLMLLCEVALGDTYDRTKADYIKKLPNGTHSCKGIGKTAPNPAESYVRPDGVEIPLGTAVSDNKMKSDLLYNEYIVYDVAQVNVQYMLKLNFKHRR